MSKRESILLSLLVILIIFIYFFFSFTSLISQKKEVEKRIQKYESNISLLKEKNKKNSEITTSIKTDEIIVIDELQIEDISSKLINIFKENGINIDRFQISKTNSWDYVDFTVTASINSFFNFIYSFNNLTYQYTIKNINVKYHSNSLKITLKVSNEPCIIYTQFSNSKPFGIRSLFPYEENNTTVPEADQIEETKKEIRKDVTFKIIGSVTDSSNKKIIYLKNEKTGRIYDIYENDLVKQNGDKYLINIENDIYEIYYRGLK